jgi:hypothetical protein
VVLGTRSTVKNQAWNGRGERWSRFLGTRCVPSCVPFPFSALLRGDCCRRGRRGRTFSNSLNVPGFLWLPPP